MEQDAGSQIPEPLCFIHPGEGFVQLFSFRSHNFFRFSLKNKGLKADERFRTFFRQVKKGQHVLRGKANAAVGVRCSEAVRPVGAVDLDVALPRIGVSGVQAVQPQDARQDEVRMFIHSLRDGGRVAANREPRDEDGVLRQSRSDFFADAEAAQGRFS